MGTVDAPDSSQQPAFEVVSKDVTMMPGTEFTYCYYFHTPNTKAVAINKWSATMTPGSHHMIMFLNNGPQPADGTVDQSGCGVGGSGGAQNPPIWTFATQTPTAELSLPIDDGAGKPLAQKIPANQAAYFQMHYLNSTDQPQTVHVDLKAFALADNVAYTQTDAFITYNSQLSIPPHATNLVQSMSCNVPAGVKFWLVSTHSHKQSIKTELLDGASSVFSSADWEHPGTKQMMTPAQFYTFSSGKLTYACTYNNTGQTAPPDNSNTTIVSGPSAQTNEMCMGTGYFFPATGPKFCLNNLGPF